MRPGPPNRSRALGGVGARDGVRLPVRLDDPAAAQLDIDVPCHRPRRHVHPPSCTLTARRHLQVTTGQVNELAATDDDLVRVLDEVDPLTQAEIPDVSVGAPSRAASPVEWSDAGCLGARAAPGGRHVSVAFRGWARWLAGGSMDGRAPGDRPILVRVDRVPEIAAALDSASIRRDRPVLVLVGGAGGMDDSHMRLLEVVLRDVVVPVVAERAAVVVDGGTDSGVMRAIGRARSTTGAEFPLVGVAARGTVVAPGGAPAIGGAARLEAHHTHVVLVPGTTWGDESPWLAEVADVVAGVAPSVTVLFNGGEISYDDVSRSLEKGRPVVVLAGTGRTADTIAAAATGCEGDPRAQRIAESELIRVVPIEDVAAVRAAVAGALSPH